MTELYYKKQWWKNIRKIVFTRDKYKCQRCRRERTVDILTVHHIIPRSKSGGDTEDNLITLCDSCHEFVEHNIGIYSTPELIANSYPCDQEKEEDEFDPDKEDWGEGVPYTDTWDAPIYPHGYVDRHRPQWHSIVYGGGKSP